MSPPRGARFARASATATTGLSEAAWQDRVLGWARGTGWTAYHTHDSRRSAAGFPDLTMVRADRLVFAELKTDRGKATPEQMMWLSLLAGAGAETYLWRPADEAAVLDCLARRR